VLCRRSQRCRQNGATLLTAHTIGRSGCRARHAVMKSSGVNNSMRYERRNGPFTATRISSVARVGRIRQRYQVRVWCCESTALTFVKVVADTPTTKKYRVQRSLSPWSSRQRAGHPWRMGALIGLPSRLQLPR